MKKWIFLVVMMMARPEAQARIKVIGNGGDAFDCPDRVITLDYYEGQSLFRYDFENLTGDGEARARQMLERLRRKSRGQADRLEIQLDQILKNTVELKDVELVDIEDSYHPLQPPGCILRQLGVYVTQTPAEYIGKLVVDKDLLARMDPSQAALFYLHEAAYKELREQHGDTTSLRARILTQTVTAQDFLELDQIEQWRQLSQFGVYHFKYAGLYGYAIASRETYELYQKHREQTRRGQAELFRDLSTYNSPFFTVLPGPDGFIAEATSSNMIFTQLENASDLSTLFLSIQDDVHLTAASGEVHVRAFATPFGDRIDSISRIQFSPAQAASEPSIRQLDGGEMVLWPDGRQTPNYGGLKITDRGEIHLQSAVGGTWSDYSPYAYRRPVVPVAGQESSHELGTRIYESLGAGRIRSFFDSYQPSGFRDAFGVEYQGELLIDPARMVIVRSVDPDALVYASPSDVEVPGANRVMRVRRGRFYQGDERYLVGEYPNQCALLFHEDGRRVTTFHASTYLRMMHKGDEVGDINRCAPPSK